jgi:ubiquinone/menaquinone biosynthesis C-methylase UbiE
VTPPPVDEPVVGYGRPVDEADAAKEATRHGLLATGFDRGSANLISRLGIGPGWRVLEVGAGGGSLARWLAAEVGAPGSVLATDVDLQFVGEQPANVELRRHDIARDPLPDDHFDLVHARAVLQHVAERELALGRMVAATRPGGWVVVEDVDWLVFEQQVLPEPFATLSRTTLARSVETYGYDGHWGRRMLTAMVEAGLEEVDSRGNVVTMHGGTASAEWYVLALERSAPSLVADGLLAAELVEEALAQARDPEFRVLGPLTISAWGRRPGAPPS